MWGANRQVEGRPQGEEMCHVFLPVGCDIPHPGAGWTSGEDAGPVVRAAGMDRQPFPVLGTPLIVKPTDLVPDLLATSRIYEGQAGSTESGPAEAGSEDPAGLAKDPIQGDQGRASALVVIDGALPGVVHQGAEPDDVTGQPGRGAGLHALVFGEEVGGSPAKGLGQPLPIRIEHGPGYVAKLRGIQAPIA